jgi:transcriptional repressor NrdR
MVVKNDGRRERFDRNKLRTGLVKACEKRPVSAVEFDRIVDGIESLLHDVEERELPTSRIGALVMERLRELDKVAYVRFASVYRKFEDVDEFLHELKNLIGRADTKVPS